MLIFLCALITCMVALAILLILQAHAERLRQLVDCVMYILMCVLA